MVYIRGLSKKFVEFLDKNKDHCPITTKYLHVKDLHSTDIITKFQRNQLKNNTSMPLSVTEVKDTRSTPMTLTSFYDDVVFNVRRRSISGSSQSMQQVCILPYK